MTGCCGEYDCRRTQPIRLLRSDLTGCWYVVTRWVERADGTIEARQKHALHPVDLTRLGLTEANEQNS